MAVYISIFTQYLLKASPIYLCGLQSLNKISLYVYETTASWSKQVARRYSVFTEIYQKLKLIGSHQSHVTFDVTV